MKQIRDMIARRRPTSQPGLDDTGETLFPAETESRDTALGLVGDLDQAEVDDPTLHGKDDLDLSAARFARDAVPRFSERPPSIADGRPTDMMGETAPGSQEEPPRRKIWDLEPSDDGRSSEDVLASALAKSVAPKPRLPDIPADAGLPEHDVPSQPAASGGRVKTRLLGFHAADLKQDIFDESATPAAAERTTFPIGWVVVVDGPGRGESFALTAGLSTIGRGSDQTVMLDFGDSSISRDNHAAIAFDEEENTAFIGHGGKSNIVRLNGKPLLTTEELQDADLIRIGKTTLRYVALCGPEFRWSVQGDEDAQDAENE